MTIYDEQVKRDKAHHEKRIAWLTQENPLWSCGTPVSKADIDIYLRQSRFAIDHPHEAYGACQCEPACSQINGETA